MQYQDCALRAQPQNGRRVPDLSTHMLADANINPETGLATDYLNHFHEAIMLLDMLSSVPDCRDDFLAWRPMSYCEHFAASRLRGRDLAIAAYDTVDPMRRAWLEALVDSMQVLLAETRAIVATNIDHGIAGTIGGRAAAQLRPLVASAAALINGGNQVEGCDSAQAAIDDLLKS